MSNKQLFVQPRLQGGYAIRRPKALRASAVCATQAEAIRRAREIEPETTPLIGRVRYTVHGVPDKWRRP